MEIVLIRKYLILLCVLLLVGCTNLPFRLVSNQQAGTAIPEVTPVSSAPATAVAGESVITGQPRRTQVIAQTAEAATLKIWVPPEFDPNGNNPASQLLKARFEEFMAVNPGIDLEVRAKALDGPGGLLDTLTNASAAAPLALPDLILLPRSLLESAALKGLLHPYEGLTNLIETPNWFGYARQLAYLKDKVYGIPFAGDAQALAYHPSLIKAPPDNLEEMVSLGEVLLFPAIDPHALFTLGQYLSGGEELQDVEGRPALDKDKLESLFTIYQRASQEGVMPFWLTQYSDYEQVWEAFRGEQFPMAVTWVSDYLEHKQVTPSDLSLVSLPGLEDNPSSLATGWSWALAGQDARSRALSVRLAEFLVEKEFMASWTQAAGYLPPRADALQEWNDASLRKRVEQISLHAQLMPPTEMISSIGPAFEQAVVEILKAENSPENAAQTVIDKINQP